jgi:hypothetical protein
MALKKVVACCMDVPPNDAHETVRMVFGCGNVPTDSFTLPVETDRVA